MTNIQKLLVVIRLLEQMFLRHSSLESHKNTIDDVRNLLKDLSEKIKQLRTQYLLWNRFPRTAGSQIHKQISSLQVVCSSYDRWLSKLAEPLRDKITQLTVDVNNKDLHQRFMQRQKLECFFNYKKRKLEQELDVLQSMIKRSKH